MGTACDDRGSGRDLKTRQDPFEQTSPSWYGFEWETLKGSMVLRWLAKVSKLTVPTILGTCLLCSSLSAQSYVPKKGGVYFRVDDNRPASRLTQYAAIFDKYSLKTCLGINITDVSSNPSFISTLVAIQSHGHELMDHTPDHAAQYFMVAGDTAYYSGRAGVDHITGHKICLRYQPVDTTTILGAGYADVDGNLVISSQPGEFSDLSWFLQIYFPWLDTLCDISSIRNANPADVDSIYILSAWDEPIQLGTQIHTRYMKIGIRGGRLREDAVKLLAERSLLLFSQAGLGRPYAWVQPGNYGPNLDRKDVKRVYGEMYEYQSGATYWDESHKVFNEYDPDSDKRFSVMWSDFSEGSDSLQSLKTFIADRVARHYVVAGATHLSDDDAGFQSYLVKMDSLLAWCVRSGIPVRTQTEWANILYGSTPDPYENIVPPLNVDLDANSVPDGYVNYDGTLDRRDGVPASGGISYSINKVGSLCGILKLGGLEKGDNDFVLWIKGPLGSKVRIYFSSFSPVSHSPIQATFAISSTAWKKYALSDATSGPGSIFIPPDVSYCDVGIMCDDSQSGVVKISGMELRKRLDSPGTPLLSQPAHNATNLPLNLTLRWEETPGATSYRLQLSADSLFRTSVVDDSSLTVTWRNVGRLTNAERYFWRVKSKNGAGQSNWSTVWAFNTTPPIPKKPTLSEPKDKSTGQPTTLVFQWLPVEYAATYWLQLSTKQDFSPLLVNDPNIVTPSRSVSGLANNQRYHWRVKSANAAGESPWSSKWTFLTARLAGAPAANHAPSMFDLLWPQNGDVLLLSDAPTVFRWHRAFDEDADSVSYDLRIGGSGKDTTCVGLVDTAFVFDGKDFFQQNVQYHWSVTANDPLGAATTSDVFWFTAVAATAVRPEIRAVPAACVLDQNYPNPFNPSTVIRYGLPQRANVSLLVYDALGRLVATLVDEVQDAGYHDRVFRGDVLASGAYFCRLRIDGFVQTKRLILLR